MATYVIETYLSRARSDELEGSSARLREVIEREAGRASPQGPAVRLVRTFYVADDEIAYYIVEAASEEDARAVARVAGLIPERVVVASSPSG